jgi:hypothetical protein
MYFGNHHFLSIVIIVCYSIVLLYNRRLFYYFFIHMVYSNQFFLPCFNKNFEMHRNLWGPLSRHKMMNNDCTTVDDEVYIKVDNVISLSSEEQVERWILLDQEDEARRIQPIMIVYQATLLMVLRSLVQMKVIKWLLIVIRSHVLIRVSLQTQNPTSTASSTPRDFGWQY